MQHLVYDSSKHNLVVGVYASNAAAVAEAAKEVNWGATQITGAPNVDVGWYVTLGSPNTVSETVPAAASTESDRLVGYAATSRSFLAGLDRLPTWRESVSGNAAAATLAARRWLFHHAALAQRIQDKTVFASIEDGPRATLLAHIRAGMAARSETIWNTFEGDKTKRDAWGAVAVAAGSALQADLVSSAGAIRQPDGSNTAITGGTVPTKFTPEHPGLT